MAKTKREVESEKLREVIKTDLLDQLDRNGTVGKYYADLVEDYMSLWDAKTKLADDIKKRGAKVLIETANSANIKTNDSVPDLLKVNAQMLKILDTIGVKPSPIGGGENSGDEM